ncbi:MAG: hypothetical protein RIR00_1248, partial [Pseudomonadota bacterium]
LRMNLATSKPFPLPVVAFGPGSQNEGDAGPAYLDMPKGMDTFHAPRLPDNATPAALLAAADWLAQFCTAAENAGLDAGYSDDLGQLDPLVREVLNQSLAFGEVSAFTSAPEHWRAQETAFAGFWRVLQLDGDSRILSDRLQAARIPPQLISAMQASTQPELATPDYPPGTMNAPALVEELRQAAAAWQAGQPAHVVNLTLLPFRKPTSTPSTPGWATGRSRCCPAATAIAGSPAPGSATSGGSSTSTAWTR